MWDRTKELMGSLMLGELLQGLESRKSQKYWRRYRELLRELAG